MGNDVPRITIYARILNNLNDEQIEGYVDIRRKKGNFNFGSINGITGGESSNIVEFDIWNNEPAWSAGMLAEIAQDATNCKFTAWDNDSCRSDDSLTAIDGTYFTHARDISDGNYRKPFVGIGGPRGLQVHKGQMVNDPSTDKAVLSGQAGGDHFKIQTKIVVPSLTDVDQNLGYVKKNFVFAFHYDFV